MEYQVIRRLNAYPPGGSMRKIFGAAEIIYSGEIKDIDDCVDPGIDLVDRYFFKHRGDSIYCQHAIWRRGDSGTFNPTIITDISFPLNNDFLKVFKKVYKK